MTELRFKADDPVSGLERFMAERRKLGPLRRIRAGVAHVVGEDAERNTIRVDGIGYGHDELRDLLLLSGASYNPESVHERPAEGEEKVFEVVRTDPWSPERGASGRRLSERRIGIPPAAGESAP